MRDKSFDYCVQLRTERWRLPHDSRHLLNRDAHYFQTTPMLNIREWNKSVQSALQRSGTQISIFQDIRKKFPVTKHSGRRYAPTITDRISNLVVRTGGKIQQSLSNFFSSLRS